LGIKGLFILLGAMGLATLWEVIFADVGVALIAIFNGGRILRFRTAKNLFLKYHSYSLKSLMLFYLIL